MKLPVYSGHIGCDKETRSPTVKPKSLRSQQPYNKHSLQHSYIGAQIFRIGRWGPFKKVLANILRPLI